jgi:copper chaperone
VVTAPIKSKIDLSDSVSEFTVDLQTQEVVVKGTTPYDEVLATIKKTGKEVSMDIISR